MKKSEALALISFESIMRDPLPPVEWIVDRLIPEGDRVVVAQSFVVRLEDDGPDSPARLIYAGTPKGHKAEAGKLSHGKKLIIDYLRGVPPLSSGNIVALLDTADISERAAERAIEALKKKGAICPGERAGTWTLPKPATAPSATS